MERTIMHVDVNNAFLSWTAVEKLKNGEELDIRTIPSIIGGDETKRSGIVLAKSTIAKQLGIVTGETIYQARKKCNNLKVYKSDFKIYKKYSDALYEILLEYTELIERYSIDECFLDMTHYLRNRNILDIAKEISTKVKSKLGFTVNIGISENKLLAKMASDFEKPDKIHTLYKSEIQSKMWNLPVKELFMLGRKTVPKLYNLNIKTIGDLAKSDENNIIKKFGKHGKLIWEYANGIDESKVNSKKELPKGVGNSTTLSVDLCKIEEIEKILLALSEQVTYRLRKYNLLANTVNIQLRTKEFLDYSHQGKLNCATSNTREIYEKSVELLKEKYNGELIRLVGLRVDNLIKKDELQLSFFRDDKSEKAKRVDKAVDEIKNKYGYSAITRAGNLNIDSNLKYSIGKEE